MSKSPDAFRTISEVAEWLDTPAHVLRFWESRFRQVKPVKRAGGRRYYRPADMALLGGIKRLLHEDGMTIKGVQKILREKGVKHVSDLSMTVDSEIEQSDIDAAEARLMASIDAPSNTAQEPTPVAEVVPAPAKKASAEPEIDHVDDAGNDSDAPQVETEVAPAPMDHTPALTEAEQPSTDLPDSAPTGSETVPGEDASEAVDPVQLDLLAGPASAESDVIEPVKAPASEAPEAAEPAETATRVADKTTETHDEPAAPTPIICDVPDDPTDESVVVDNTDGDTALVMLLAADPADFAGKSTALRALLDRIKGADGKLADGL